MRVVESRPIQDLLQNPPISPKGGAFSMVERSGFEYFMEIVSKPDNIPIVGMLILVIFFSWIGLRQGMRNDKLVKEGKESDIPEEMWK